MRTLVLAIALLALAPLAAAAPATEAHPDCEAGQPWLGYRTSDPARAAYEAQGSPGGLALCEGEHWDGQDSISPAQGSCPAAIDPEPSRLHANVCTGADPNAGSGDDPADPVGARVSSDGERAYVALKLALVSRQAVYADEGSAAVYWRDDTPQNVVFTTLTCCRLTPPVSEIDCDQATYQDGAYAGDRRCDARDNTAITLQHGLLA